MKIQLSALLSTFAAALLLTIPARAEPPAHDVVVYGGTPGGIIAAVQAGRMGKNVVLIEPTRHIGGMTSGGLGATDMGNQRAIGGVSREFYKRVKDYYADPVKWKFETATNMPNVNIITFPMRCSASSRMLRNSFSTRCWPRQR